MKWYQMLAECYRQSADYARAMETYRLAVDLFPLSCGPCLRALIKLTGELGLEGEEEKNGYKLKLDKLREFEQL